MISSTTELRTLKSVCPRVEVRILDLQTWLTSQKIWYRFIEKPETIHTADASAVTGVDLTRLTKNLVSKTSTGEYILIIVSGTAKVDLKKVAKVLGVSNISLASFAEAESVSGYPPGATPSVFHKSKLRVIMDNSLIANDTLFCGGGARNRILELKVEDVVGLNDALVSDIQKK